MVPKRIHSEAWDRTRPSSQAAKGLVCLLLMIVAAVAVGGCQLVPNRPTAVFSLYREDMKSQEIPQARKLLSQESRRLIQQITTAYKLKQLPEDLALLNALDPVSEPTLMKSEPTEALLQVRTLKGGLRLIRLTRKTPNSQWTIDLSEELHALESFLKARSALEDMRDQASEFAASWSAFNRQLHKIHVTEPPPSTPAATTSPLKHRLYKPHKPKPTLKRKPRRARQHKPGNKKSARRVNRMSARTSRIPRH
jgi:hypothetical protein